MQNPSAMSEVGLDWFRLLQFFVCFLACAGSSLTDLALDLLQLLEPAQVLELWVRNTCTGSKNAKQIHSLYLFMKTGRQIAEHFHRSPALRCKPFQQAPQTLLVREDAVLQEEVLPIRKRNNKLKTMRHTRRSLGKAQPSCCVELAKHRRLEGRQRRRSCLPWSCPGDDPEEGQEVRQASSEEECFGGYQARFQW